MAKNLNGVSPTIASLVSVLVCIGCGEGKDQGSTPATPTIAFEKHGELSLEREGAPYLKIDIEIADSDSSRMRGMMQRTGFPEGTGMLFIFPVEEIQTFWMANTPVALDILFANADSQIVDIHKYTRPLSPENVTSEEPALFVLEVPAGFVDSNGIIETDYLAWARTAP